MEGEVGRGCQASVTARARPLTLALSLRERGFDATDKKLSFSAPSASSASPARVGPGSPSADVADAMDSKGPLDVRRGSVAERLLMPSLAEDAASVEPAEESHLLFLF
jgi:hypothetical protein